MNELHGQIAAALRKSTGREAVLNEALQWILTAFHSETGTIHLLNRETQSLHLAAQIGLPPQMLDTVKTIPVGKGIAGQTVAQGRPVTICNLQTDTSGVARPAARQTGVGGALSVPLRNGEVIVGTLGVGTLRAYEYTPQETRVLEDIGRLLGGQFS